MPPPDQRALISKIASQVDGFARLSKIMGLYSTGIAHDSYLSWDDLRYRRPPEGYTPEEWWLAVKIARQGMHRPLPLLDEDERPFLYALPDELLRETEFISANASGNIALPEVVTNP